MLRDLTANISGDEKTQSDDYYDDECVSFGRQENSSAKNVSLHVPSGRFTPVAAPEAGSDSRNPQCNGEHM